MSAEEDHPDEQENDDQQDRATTDVHTVGQETEHAEGVPRRIDYQADLPVYMRGLPVDEAGRPVPKFVEWVDGKPDFRLMSGKFLRKCVMTNCCWVCGVQMGRYAAFVSGPMCLVNLNSAEPPAHYDCALYSATHCPFLINPNKIRREANLPEEGLTDPAGIMIRRNPGVTALVVVTAWTPYRDGNGVLFNIGTKRLGGHADFIERVEWYRESRKASRAEVTEAVESGLPALAEICDGDPACLAVLAVKVDEAKRWFPE